MNKIEHLLTCLIEECAEIQKLASKANRFGLDDGYPGEGNTNRINLGNEFNDLIAVVEMIEDIYPELFTIVDEKVDAKKKKVLKYMSYAKENGTLIDKENTTCIDIGLCQKCSNAIAQKDKKEKCYNIIGCKLSKNPNMGINCPLIRG